MNIIDFFNIDKNPLPTAFVIYLAIAGIVVYCKPIIVFGSPEEEDDERGEQKVWIFFILLAVFVYGAVSSYISNKIRNRYLGKMSGGSIEDLINIANNS